MKNFHFCLVSVFETCTIYEFTFQGGKEAFTHGTGHCILALAQSVGNSGKVYGIDISEGMYNITQSRVRKAELSDRVELKCGEVAKIIAYRYP